MLFVIYRHTLKIVDSGEWNIPLKNKSREWCHTVKKSLEGGAMKPEEINIYREIQKNAEMGMKAIETLSDKVYEDEFARQISRQSLKY